MTFLLLCMCKIHVDEAGQMILRIPVRLSVISQNTSDIYLI